jgi:predicted nucleic-acid-binding Zn-ribbon protein
MSEQLTCRKCGGEMHEGQALENTVSRGMPDFEGSNDKEGQTFSFSGEARMIKVLKCKDCGYSIRRA